MQARHIILFLFLLLSFNCFAQKSSKKKKLPPGTAQINDTLFVDKTEIANVHWREYLYFLTSIKANNEAYIKALPDTLSWNDDSLYKNALSEIYFRHPSFNYYPVIGISYEQAMEFCKWRTFVVNLSNYMDENNFKNFKEHLNDSFPVKLYYRLPTLKEWEMIAEGTMNVNEFPYGYKEINPAWKRKKTKAFNCIYPYDKSKEMLPDEIKYYTASVESFYKNTSGAFNMIGNVAEMVSEKGIAKGGSFIHSLDSCKISMNQFYTKPEKWLGFRCVAVKVQ